MNATGLNIIKTLGCMTAVTFFTIYNTWDHYDYDYHWILGFLTFISTIATPLFFVVAGYLDGQSRHGTRWQLGNCLSVLDNDLLPVGAVSTRVFNSAVVRVCVCGYLQLPPGGGVA